MNKLILSAIAAALAANVAGAQSVAAANGVLTDASGRSLYTFDRDAIGKSNCNGGCATAWPPFMVKDSGSEGSGLSAIMRDDGSKQWALHGKPLYYFAADVRPGDLNGDGQGGVWHLVRDAAQRFETKPTPALRVQNYGSYGGD